MTPLGELLIDVHRLAVLREVARAGSFAGAAAASPSPTPAGPCSPPPARSTPSWS
jgi:hypothetical protein